MFCVHKSIALRVLLGNTSREDLQGLRWKSTILHEQSQGIEREVTFISTTARSVTSSSWHTVRQSRLHMCPNKVLPGAAVDVLHIAHSALKQASDAQMQVQD